MGYPLVAHRAINARTGPVLGFKTFAISARTIAGLQLVHRIRKGQFMLLRKPGPKPKLAMRAAWNIALASCPSCGRLVESTHVSHPRSCCTSTPLARIHRRPETACNCRQIPDLEEAWQNIDAVETIASAFIAELIESRAGPGRAGFGNDSLRERGRHGEIEHKQRLLGDVVVEFAIDVKTFSLQCLRCDAPNRRTAVRAPVHLFFQKPIASRIRRRASCWAFATSTIVKSCASVPIACAPTRLRSETT